MSGYSFPNPCIFCARSYYGPFWRNLYSSSNHNITTCVFYVCYSQPNLSIPFAQCTGLEVGEPFRFVANFDVVNACCE